MNFARLKIIIVPLLLSLIVTGCADISQNRHADSNTADSIRVPDSQFYGATHYIYKGGRVTAKILTDSSWTFDANDSTVAWNLDVFFYDSTGQISTALIADSGVIRSNLGEYRIYGHLEAEFYDSLGVPNSHLVGDSGLIQEHSGYLHIYDNVVVTSQNERKLETQYLRWNIAKDVIDTDAFVKFTRGKEDVISSFGLIADRGLTRVRLLNQVSGTVVQRERRKTTKKIETIESPAGDTVDGT